MLKTQRDPEETATDDRAKAVACHECGLVHAVRRVPGGGVAKCSRCGAVLYRDVIDGIDRTLMLTLASLILFVIANVYPLLTFKIEGREESSTLIEGSIDFYEQGYWELGVVVFCLSVLVPLLRIAGMLYILVPLRFGRRPWALAPAFRYLENFIPWAMVEVYMLGILVAIVKLTDFATLEIGAAVYAFAAFIVLTVATTLTLDTREIWNKVSDAARISPDALEALKTAVSCHSCNLLTRIPPVVRSQRFLCPRCGAHLHRRKPNSLSRCWALVIAAAIFYIPANVLPVMTVISFGEGEADTIFSGVIAFIESEDYPLALLVFFASIFVPVLKIVVLVFLLISVQLASRWRPRDRTVLYRMIETIGRWSMVDIFMISILVALVKLEAIATIEPGAGAVFFAAVVILTILAAMTFDPRLIWDRMEERNGRAS